MGIRKNVSVNPKADYDAILETLDQYDLPISDSLKDRLLVDLSRKRFTQEQNMNLGEIVDNLLSDINEEWPFVASIAEPFEPFPIGYLTVVRIAEKPDGALQDNGIIKFEEYQAIKWDEPPVHATVQFDREKFSVEELDFIHSNLNNVGWKQDDETPNKFNFAGISSYLYSAYQTKSAEINTLLNEILGFRRSNEYFSKTQESVNMLLAERVADAMKIPLSTLDAIGEREESESQMAIKKGHALGIFKEGELLGSTRKYPSFEVPYRWKRQGPYTTLTFNVTVSMEYDFDEKGNVKPVKVSLPVYPTFSLSLNEMDDKNLPLDKIVGTLKRKHPILFDDTKDYHADNVHIIAEWHFKSLDKMIATPEMIYSMYNDITLISQKVGSYLQTIVKLKDNTFKPA